MSIKYIKIDNRIVRNTNIKISNPAFALYVELQYLNFLNKNINTIKVYHSLLQKYLNWKDRRKLKIYLDELYDLKLIKNKINTLPRYKQITIDIAKINSKHFIFIPETLIENIKIIGEIGLRLICYYMSHINKKQPYAFPSYETLENNLDISSHTITRYNKILEKDNHLIKIDKQKNEGNFINPITGKSFVKFNNHYYLRLDNILKFNIGNSKDNKT